MRRETFFEVFEEPNEKGQMFGLFNGFHDDFVEYADSIDREKYDLIYWDWSGNNVKFVLTPKKKED